MKNKYLIIRIFSGVEEPHINMRHVVFVFGHGVTKNNFKTGQFKKVGNVHFSNKNHLLNLFKNFKIEILDEKIVKRKIPNNKEIFAVWNIVVKK